VLRRIDEVAPNTLNVIFVQCLYVMLSVYRKATELTVLSDSSPGCGVSVTNSERLMTGFQKRLGDHT
jgi:hypothetical protein